MSSMRAVLIKDGKGPIEHLFVGETQKPVLTSTQVLVKVRPADGHSPLKLSTTHTGSCIWT
jgi:hypothetical protein